VGRSLKRRAATVSTEVGLFLAVVLTLIPIVWLVWNSLKHVKDITSLEGPPEPTLSNYRSLLSGGSEFPTLLLNSVGVVFFTTLLCLAIGALAAYSLSKFRWPKLFVAFVLGSALAIQLVPPVALVPAYYQILSRLSLYDSITGLVIVNTLFNLPFVVFLLKVYFDGIPDDLRDAALVDGCRDLGAFLRVMVPLAAPGIAAVTILVSVLAWNEFLMALSLTLSPRAQTTTVGIAGFIQEASVEYGQMSAAAAMATVPVLVLAAVAHRYIVVGLTGGAIKE
jgi:multiple sugar transport system permease protein